MLETNGKDFFKFVFGTAGNVSVTIKTENNLTICELTQSEIPTDDASRAEYHVGCTEGWTFYLANLKSILQGGIDLRNKDAKVKGVVTISSPGPTPSAIRLISKASVPLAQVMQCLAPVKAASLSSSSLTSGPMMYWPCSSTASMRAWICGLSAWYWVLRSMKERFMYVGISIGHD